MRHPILAIFLLCLAALPCLGADTPPGVTPGVNIWEDLRSLGPVGAVIGFILWEWRKGHKTREERDKLMDAALKAGNNTQLLVNVVQRSTAAFEHLVTLLEELPRICPKDKEEPT